MASAVNKAKARQSKRNEGWYKAYAASNRALRNKKRRMIRSLKQGKMMNRELCLRLKALFGTEFTPSPHVASNAGPFFITLRGAYE